MSTEWGFAAIEGKHLGVSGTPVADKVGEALAKGGIPDANGLQMRIGKDAAETIEALVEAGGGDGTPFLDAVDLSHIDMAEIEADPYNTGYVAVPPSAPETALGSFAIQALKDISALVETLEAKRQEVSGETERKYVYTEGGGVIEVGLTFTSAGAAKAYKTYREIAKSLESVAAAARYARKEEQRQALQEAVMGEIWTEGTPKEDIMVALQEKLDSYRKLSGPQASKLREDSRSQFAEFVKKMATDPDFVTVMGIEQQNCDALSKVHDATAHTVAKYPVQSTSAEDAKKHAAFVAEANNAHKDWPTAQQEALRNLAKRDQGVHV